MSRRALILGAKSLIARALAQVLAQDHGYDLILGARGIDQLEPFGADLMLRTGRRVDRFEFDALDTDAVSGLAQRAQGDGVDFDLVIQVFGYLGNQRRAEGDGQELLRIINTNYTAAVLTLNHLAGYLLDRGKPGGIIGIASVAGDRGRQSNYAYGSAKGALALYLQGLRNRLMDSGIHVLTVKPGFVDTPMIAGLDGLFLVASPERVAGDIVRGYLRGRDVLYTPWFWRYIMLLVRAIPERLFKRLHL